MKKYLSILLALIMVIASVSLVFAEEAVLDLASPDIKVAEVVEPEGSLELKTSAEPAVIPANECKKDENCIAYKFKDVDLNASYHDTIHTVLTRGLMNGVSEEAFDLTSAVTKEMFEVVLYRLAG